MPLKIETLDQRDNSISIALKAYFYNSTQSCIDTVCLCQSEKLCLKRLIEDTEQRISVGFCFFFHFGKSSLSHRAMRWTYTTHQHRNKTASGAQQTKVGERIARAPALILFTHTLGSRPPCAQSKGGIDRCDRSFGTIKKATKVSPPSTDRHRMVDRRVKPRSRK